tara:strand:- start:1650 stop:2600 length:951 start_codon:yes stop_codon:yes gene_type:complete
MKNKKILIIGGTGALGKTLIQRYYNNNVILILSRDEHKHVNLQKQYKNLLFQIGNIKEKGTIEKSLKEFRPHIVINTAALKHVPICESNTYESVKTNIIGNNNVIDAIRMHGDMVETLIFVSTDKACKPINIYGMCKAISERLYIDFANKQDKIKTCLVRYGNVLESTGSVIPYFKQLLEDGSTHLPITDTKMTRFLLSLDQAVDLIEWAYENDNSHGKIAIPHVKSFKITSIAKALIKKYNLTNKVELKTIGIRPGEKIHEEMISSEEWMRTYKNGKNYLIGDDIIAPEGKSYSSHDLIMDDNETYNFLIENRVI